MNDPNVQNMPLMSKNAKKTRWRIFLVTVEIFEIPKTEERNPTKTQTNVEHEKYQSNTKHQNNDRKTMSL